MNRRNTPLHALRAFEVAARLGSFSAAADELLVTHSAVSQQIRTLEDLLGIRLFDRTNRGIELTDAAKKLAPVLSHSFDSIEKTLDELAHSGELRRLTVTATPSFTSKWLTPRLKNWSPDETEFDIHFKPTLGHLNLVAGEADVAVRCGVPPWEGLVAEPLLPIHLVPLCSPQHPLAGNTPVEPDELLKHKLIHADIAGHPLGEEWRLWFEGVGVSCPEEFSGLSFADPSMALQAAMEGAGIAIGYQELATADIAAGKLIPLSDQVIRHQFSYFLVFPPSAATSDKVRRFKTWISASLPATGDSASTVSS